MKLMIMKCDIEEEINLVIKIKMLFWKFSKKEKLYEISINTIIYIYIIKILITLIYNLFQKNLV